MKTVMSPVHPAMDDEPMRRDVINAISLYPQGCENPVYPTTDGESARRWVITDIILLYPRDVRTLASCCRLILLSLIVDTVVAFALTRTRMGGLTAELYGGRAGCGDDGRRGRGSWWWRKGYRWGPDIFHFPFCWLQEDATRVWWGRERMKLGEGRSGSRTGNIFLSAKTSEDDLCTREI
jgi:hypothetical protein